MKEQITKPKWLEKSLKKAPKSIIMAITQLSKKLQQASERLTYEPAEQSGNLEIGSREFEGRVQQRATKLVEANEQLRQEINHLKSELLTTIHELRTPLTSVLGLSEMLLASDLGPSHRRRCLHIITEQSAHLTRIVDDLLEIYRLEAKPTFELNLESVSIFRLMRDVVLPFAEVTSIHDIHFEGVEGLSPVKGDPFRLAQVGRNLLSNAIKYSPQGGRITIRARVVTNFVEISVQDEGVGMTRAQQEPLFEPFYRADAYNLAIGGTGLGLAISKMIIERHGGKIWVESEQGTGTTVYFTLPAADDDPT